MRSEHMPTRRTVCKALGSTIALGSFAGCLGSEGEYPADPVEIVIPMDAGGGNDPYARSITDPLSDELGVDVNVVNEPPPTQRYPELLNQNTDGYSISIHNATPFVPLVLEQGFDTAFNLNSWYQLGAPNMGSLAMAMSTQADADSWEEAVSMSEEEGVEWNAALATAGDINYQLMQEYSGIQFNEVGGYDGSGAIFADMERGNVDFYFSPSLTQIPRIRDGIAKPVLIGDKEALSDQVATAYEDEGYTDVPGLADVGLENLVPLAVTIRGFIVSPQAEESRRETLRDAVWSVIQTDGYAEAVEEQELVASPTSPEEQNEYAQNLEEAIRNVQEDM